MSKDVSQTDPWKPQAISYDEVLYPTQSHYQTHPDRLGTMGLLFGMQPAPVERCRVLELGCGNGSNLVPMAHSLPQSEFVGVDLAAVPVENACRMASEIGLKNVTFHQRSIAEVTEDLGTFDYIIAHGVYSWVPADVRDRLMAVCRGNLRPQGVAFVSYNTYPGHRLKEMAREMVLYHVRGFEEPKKKVQQAIALARFIADAQSGNDTYRMFLKELMEHMLEVDPNYLLHDLLEQVNQPVYFHQFCEHAARHQLQYLGEADFHEMLDRRLGPEVSQTLEQLSRNRIAREQYLDFLKCRQFRQTLLCHAEVKLDLAPKPELAARFHVIANTLPQTPSPDLRSTTVEQFAAPSGASIRTSSPIVKAALVELHKRWPQPIHFGELLEQGIRVIGGECPAEAKAQAALELGKLLLQGFALGIVELHLYRPSGVTEPGIRPKANALARWQAAHAKSITSLYHRSFRMQDPLGRNLLLLLDGSREHGQLGEDLFAALQREGVLPGPADDPQLAAQAKAGLIAELPNNLAKLAKLGFLAE